MLNGFLIYIKKIGLKRKKKRFECKKTLFWIHCHLNYRSDFLNP